VSSPAFIEPIDLDQRRAATDPTRSFTVQAPAGSGKTELLIQRYLRLLSVVERPEAIVAITFTRKAAGEMRERIVAALRDAKANEGPPMPHQRYTRELANGALASDAAFGWNLLEHPGRIRVQTIDALCTEIAASMPWLARLGAMPRIVDDVRPLYLEAARRTVLKLGGEHGEAIEILLKHLDGDATRLRDLLSSMLAVRDQWIELAVQTGDVERELMEEAMARNVARALATADRLIPFELRSEWTRLAVYARQRDSADWPHADQLREWRGLIDLVFTKDSGWRKRLDRNCGFLRGSDQQKNECMALIGTLTQIPGLQDALETLRSLPTVRYEDAQWDVMRALFACLKLSVAELAQVFASEGTIDFCEIGLAARRALGDDDRPTDLAFHLHGRIEHLLVDEFQDTSGGQYELIGKLIADWQPDDGRTLFLVGDPMQSIYRFRQAEVGLFLDARERGIGSLRLEPLTLRANYRSVPAIVDRANAWFSEIFPKIADAALGGIPYSESIATAAAPPADLFALADQNDAVTIDLFAGEDFSLEADRVIALIHEARLRDPDGDVAILVRARSHLTAIVEHLKQAGLTFQAVEIDLLENRPVVQDLLALTRAVLQPADRIAWLAVLRAPWCGLTLADLEALVRGRETQTIWESLQNLPAMSDDGLQRAARVCDVLSEAFEERGRWPLRRWLERVWIRLGGPACLEGDAAALRDASDFLDLLEAEQSGADLADFDRFHERVHQLYAQPAASASQWLHVMTIHKAKGLEFDTAILPGLGQRERPDDARLFLFHQWKEEEKIERLLAPIPPPRGEDPKYTYLQGVEKQKSRYERARQLYVAVTRAKKRLHLLGQVKFDKTGQPLPHGGSMLSDLWPVLAPQEQIQVHRRVVDQGRASGDARGVTMLRRLPGSWMPPEEAQPMPWEGEAREITLHEPAFEWVGESLRHTGTVVHAFLQRLGALGGAIPETSAIRKALLHEGVSPVDLGAAAGRVRAALEQIKMSDRARWIFAGHSELRTEYAITGVVGGEIVRGKVDRTFVDSQGVRWIIDYKTSVHEGAGLEAFLDEQQRRYRDQMARYARLLRPLGNPVRLALYFPLMDGWREWAFEETA